MQYDMNGFMDGSMCLSLSLVAGSCLSIAPFFNPFADDCRFYLFFCAFDSIISFGHNYNGIYAFSTRHCRILIDRSIIFRLIVAIENDNLDSFSLLNVSCNSNSNHLCC